MARILCTGNITLDIVNTVNHYPAEDEEMRAIAQHRRSGGNAANTALILNQLNQDVYFCGITANDGNGHWLRNHFLSQDINVDHLRASEGNTPTSYITVNRATGTRTIVHHRDLPEVQHHDFERISLELIDWFHFEGRNVESLEKMLLTVNQRRVDQPISLELEKHRPGLEKVATMADVLFFSRPYAEHAGFSEPEVFLSETSRKFPRTLISLTWGAQGAWGSQSGHTFHIPAHPVTNIIDSVGAGDTYNAGAIDALASGKTFEESITAGCCLAELKLGRHGLNILSS